MALTTQLPPTNSSVLISSDVSMGLVSIMVIVGVTLNALTIAVMLQHRFRSLSSSVYLMALAAADIVCLLVDFKFLEVLQKLMNIEYPPGYWLCVIEWWVSQFPFFISSWLIVAVTLERVIIVCLPLKAKSLCTRRKSWIAVVVIIISMMVISLTHALLVDGEECKVHDKTIYTILILLSISMYTILPFAIIFICNITIVCQLLKQRKFMDNKMTKTSAKAQSDTQRLTKMLITNSCVFIVLTLPYNAILFYIKIISNPEPKRDSAVYTALTICHYFVTINHCINFLLYTISGSLYRRELKDMFCGRRRGYKRGDHIDLEDNTTHTSI